MAQVMKPKVVEIYRRLLITCKNTFGQDVTNLNRVVGGIREEFRKNKHEKDPQKINEMISAAEETERFIKTNIVQAELHPEVGVYKLKIPKEFPSNSVIQSIDKIKIK